MCLFGACYFSLTALAAVYTFQLQTFHLNKTVSKKKSKKCKKQCIKNFLFFYYIQAKSGDIADKNPNAADDDERTFNYRWPKHQPHKIIKHIQTFRGEIADELFECV